MGGAAVGPEIHGLPGAVTYLFFTGLLAAVSAVDLRRQIIPDRYLLVGLAAGVPLMLWSRSLPIGRAVLGLLVAFGAMLVVALLSRGGMGGGDVKLAGVIGFFLGPAGGLLALMLAALAGAVVGVLLIGLRLKGRKDFIPYGPFLALGALVSLLWGREIVAWYSATWLR